MKDLSAVVKNDWKKLPSKFGKIQEIILDPALPKAEYVQLLEQVAGLVVNCNTALESAEAN